jgi:hypothetical protein
MKHITIAMLINCRSGGLPPQSIGIYQGYKSCGKINVLESVRGYLGFFNIGDLCDHDLTWLIITHGI